MSHFSFIFNFLLQFSLATCNTYLFTLICASFDFSGCRPECVLSSDCPTDKACVRNKCVDPCPGVCGYNAECTVVSHVPSCNCAPGFVGDPFAGCIPQPPPGKSLSLHLFLSYASLDSFIVISFALSCV